MKYDVTYSCGHTGTVQIYGTNTEREKKIAWYENYAVCPECYAKGQQEEAAIAAQQAKADGLPALTGSEKQIRWAESIRQKKMATLVTRGRALYCVICCATCSCQTIQSGCC